MLKILTFLVLISEIEMFYTPNNQMSYTPNNGTVTLKFNDLVINESKIGKNEVNKGKIYKFVDQEDVMFTCNVDHLTSKHWVLYLKEGENILKSYCSHKGEGNGEVAKNITLTANMTGSHYKCELFIGSQLNTSINKNSILCSVHDEDLEATTSIVLKVVFQVAKLNIFINKFKLKKNKMDTEVVYKYRINEKVNAMCIHDNGKIQAEWLPPAAYLITKYEDKLTALLITYPNTGLTTKENGSYFDCVENMISNNGTSRTNIQKRSSLRLRFILLEEKSLMKEPGFWIIIGITIGIKCLFFLIIVIVKRDKILKMRKGRNQGNVDINPDNSKSDAPEYTYILQSQPKLCETYTKPKSDNTNRDVYCEPYSAMYIQPLPKRARNVIKNTENHQNKDSDTYSNVKKVDYVNFVNNYTTANYMNVKQTNNVNNEPNVYDVAISGRN